MKKTLFLLLLIAGLSLVLGQIADEPAHLSVEWGNYRIQTSIMVLCLIVSLFSLACLFTYHIVLHVLLFPRKWKQGKMQKQQVKGLELLTETFAAMAVGDVGLANKQLQQAKKQLPNQPITLMLEAQLARLEGNEDKVRGHIAQMLGNSSTEFIALKSMLEQAWKENNKVLALQYAEKAIVIRPEDNWLIARLATLYAEAGRMQDAHRILHIAYKKRYINKHFLRRENALMAFENAKYLFEKEKYAEAIPVLQQTLRFMPDFTPACVLMARLYQKQHDIKTALKVILAAWKIEPAKELRDMLLELLEKYENKQKYFSLANKISNTHPEHPESELLAEELDSWEV